MEDLNFGSHLHGWNQIYNKNLTNNNFKKCMFSRSFDGFVIKKNSLTLFAGFNESAQSTTISKNLKWVYSKLLFKTNSLYITFSNKGHSLFPYILKKKHHFLLSCKTCMSFDHMTFVVWKEGSCESNVAWSNLLLHAFKALINHFLASRTFKGFKTYVSLKITIFLGPAIINHGSISPILVWQAIKLNYLVVINTLLRTYRVPEFWCGWD